jgi:transposase InsO family protein
MIGRYTTTLRSDGGKEYFNNKLKEYCAANGIAQQSSTPYIPHQNGRAERPNRNIVEGVSAMLLDSQLP